MVETINRLIKVSRQLLQELGREPSVEEIAEAMSLTPEKVREVMKISQEPISLETPIGDEEDSHLGDFIEDQEAIAPAEAASVMLLKEKMQDVLQNLTERERKVLVLRFGLEDGHQRTLEEVGQEFGVRGASARSRPRLHNSPPLARQSLKDYWSNGSRLCPPFGHKTAVVGVSQSVGLLAFALSGRHPAIVVSTSSGPTGSPSPAASSAPLHTIVTVKANPYCASLVTHFNGAMRPLIANDFSLDRVDDQLIDLKSVFNGLDYAQHYTTIRVKLVKLVGEMQKRLPPLQAEINSLRDGEKLTNDPAEAKKTHALAEKMQLAYNKQMQLTNDLLALAQGMMDFNQLSGDHPLNGQDAQTQACRDMKDVKSFLKFDGQRGVSSAESDTGDIAYDMPPPSAIRKAPHIIRAFFSDQRTLVVRLRGVGGGRHDVQVLVGERRRSVSFHPATDPCREDEAVRHRMRP